MHLLWPEFNQNKTKKVRHGEGWGMLCMWAGNKVLDLHTTLLNPETET